MLDHGVNRITIQRGHRHHRHVDNRKSSLKSWDPKVIAGSEGTPNQAGRTTGTLQAAKDATILNGKSSHRQFSMKLAHQHPQRQVSLPRRISTKLAHHHPQQSQPTAIFYEISPPAPTEKTKPDGMQVVGPW